MKIFRSPDFGAGGAGPITTTVARERDADTHGMIASGAAGLAAGATTIGQITLPALVSGEWKIFGLWGQAVPQTYTAGENIGGFFSMNAASGDLNPDPAPVQFPSHMLTSRLGATGDQPMVPLMIYPVTYTAPGKAVIDLIYSHPDALTVAPLVVMGILFGKTVPVDGRMRYCQTVQANVAVATQTLVGTIQLPEKAQRITHICAMAGQTGVLTTAEELIGTWSIDSNDIKFTPAQYPLSAVFGAGLGALINQPQAITPYMIPVNIPLIGGARLDCSITLNTALTNAADVQIFVMYE